MSEVRLMKVLLVAEDLHETERIREMLLAGGSYKFEVLERGSLEEAMAQFEDDSTRSRPDAVLLDIGPREVRTIEAFLNDFSRRSDIPIIILTDRADEEPALEAMRHGAQEYLVKEKINANALVRALRYARERKRNEEQIRYQAGILDAVSEAVISTDLSFIVRSWNKGAERMYGWSAEDVTGKLLEEAYQPVYTKGERDETYNRFMECGRYEGEATHHRKDGTKVDVFVSATMLRDTKGNPSGIVTLNRDITEIKRARRALMESEATYRALVDAAPDSVFAMDINGVLTEVSRQTCLLYGYGSAAELIGKSHLSLVAQEERERAKIDLRKTEERGTIRNREYTLVRKDGSSFAGELSASLVRDSEGHPKGFIAMARDVTQRKRMEQEARRIEKLDSLGILAGGVAHDFNNTLTSIIANLSVALDEASTGQDVRESIREALEAAQRTTGLTRQLLTFSKGGAPIKEEASIAEIVVQTAQFALSGSPCGLAFHLDENLWSAEVDRGQMSQVIENLVINAAQSMPNGGTIEIYARNTTEGSLGPGSDGTIRPGDYIVISVVDHGVGIGADHLSRIFDPFFTTKESGNGLGLATAHSIVYKHGGYFHVTSEIGQGTIFSFYLPALRRGSKRTKRKSHHSIQGTGRILLVDDDVLVLKAASRIIARLGYECQVARDGREALDLYSEAMSESWPFDLVIMDLTIPGGVGGKEAIEHLREIDPEVRAIVSSGYSHDPVMSDYRSYGFSGVAAKPYDLKELSEAINQALRYE